MIRTQPVPTTLEIESRAVITDSGLSLPEGLSYDEWLGVGRKLMLADKAVQWAIGDWWAYGDHRYGERASAAIDPDTGENRLTRYMQYGWVARSIETSRRREVLSWSAHLEVAALEPAIQDAILQRAVDNGWGSREVRAAVKEYKDRLANGNKPKLSTQTPDVEDAEIIEDEDGKPVFDSTGAGQATAAERAEKREALADQSLSDANQILMRGLDTVERALNAENRRMLPLARLNTARLRAVAAELTRLADEADIAQSGRMTPKKNAGPFSQEATAKGEADGKTDPRTASPKNPHPAVISVQPEPDGAGGFTDPHPSPVPSTPFSTQMIDGREVEQPDDIPGFLRR